MLQLDMENDSNPLPKAGAEDSKQEENPEDLQPKNKSKPKNNQKPTLKDQQEQNEDYGLEVNSNHAPKKSKD